MIEKMIEKIKKIKVATIRKAFGTFGTFLIATFIDKIFDWSDMSFAMQYVTVMLAVGGITFILAAIAIFFFAEED